MADGQRSLGRTAAEGAAWGLGFVAMGGLLKLLYNKITEDSDGDDDDGDDSDDNGSED